MVDRRLIARFLAVLGLLVALVAGGAQVASATTQAANDDDAVQITLYHGDGCPNCAKLIDLLEEIVAEHPEVEVVKYEVWNSGHNRDLFEQAGDDLGFDAGPVPTTVLDGRVWIGYSEPIADDIRAAVDLALAGDPVPTGVYGTPGAGTCSEG